MAERYIKMSHNCYESLYVLPMSDGERRVLMMIIRYTVGFHRFDTEFSDRYAAQALEMSCSGVNRCVNALIKKNYIYIISKGSGPHARKIGLNYKEISAHFQAKKRSLFDTKALIFDTKSAHLERAKKEKEIKEQQIKKKETLQATSFSLSREKEHIPEGEEWERMLAEQWDEEEEDATNL